MTKPLPTIVPGGQPFNRVGELVDFDDYLPFLPDDPDTAPVDLDTKIPYSDRRWVNQHVYFMKNLYKLLGHPFAELSGSPHSQIVMRPKEERWLHSVFEKHVEPPSAEVALDSLSDFRQLDILGASVVGREVAIDPTWVPGTIQDPVLPTLPNVLSRFDSTDFFDSQIEEALSKLEQPLVTPERVVASAIRRMAILLDNKKLLSESVERSADGIYYSLRTQKLSTLGHMAMQTLLSAVNHEQEGATPLA